MKKWIALPLAALLAAAAAGCGERTMEPPPSLNENSGVFAHWDALTPYEAPQNQYTRRWADFTDHLIPADDYGNLIAFPGKVVTTEWMGDVWLYGLVTTEGEIVVDPVYSSARQLSTYDVDEGVSYLPYLLLQKARPGATDGEDTMESAIAALDGSWVREGYATYLGCTEGMVVLGTAEGRMEVLDGDGTVLWSKTAAELGLSEEVLEYEGVAQIAEGMLYYWDEGDFYILNLATAELAVRDQKETDFFGYFSSGLATARHSGTGLYGYLDKTGAWALEAQYIEAEAFRGGRAAVILPDGTAGVIDTAGEVLLRCETGELFCSRGRDGSVCYLNVEPAERVQLGEYRSYAQYRVLGVYDGAFAPVNRPAQGEQIVRSYDGCYWILNGDRLTIGSGMEQTVIQLPKGVIFADSTLTGDGFLLEMEAESDGAYLYGYYSSDGTLLLEPGQYRYLYEGRDLWTGEAYLIGYQKNSGYDILDGAGNVCFSSADGFAPQFTGGLALVQDLYGVGLQDTAGHWVFRYLIMNA